MGFWEGIVLEPRTQIHDKTSVWWDLNSSWCVSGMNSNRVIPCQAFQCGWNLCVDQPRFAQFGAISIEIPVSEILDHEANWRWCAWLHDRFRWNDSIGCYFPDTCEALESCTVIKYSILTCCPWRHRFLKLHTKEFGPIRLDYNGLTFMEN